MLVLSVETSGNIGGIALLQNEMIVAEKIFSEGLIHAKSLFPGINDLLTEEKISINQIDLLAVSQGPGSFTGLRIGVTAVKTLAYVLKIPAVGVITLDAMASEVDAKVCCPVIDARMKSMYTAVYKEKDGKKVRTSDYMLVTPEELEGVFPENSFVFGDAVTKYKNLIKDYKFDFSETPVSPKPGTIAKIGLEKYENNQTCKLEALNPFYLRRSEAEVKWDRRHGEPNAEHVDFEEIERIASKGDHK